MELKVGQTLISGVDDTSVIVTRAPVGPIELTCGGVSMHPKGAAVDRVEADPGLRGGTSIGKRYVNQADTLEVLCTKPGTGTLAADGQALQLAAAKALPSSD